ncbi:c-type cytochrome [Alteraurantiacibacter palmitatis]|uniref:C-type cytochrome n=1 Tax=Alteraurantiacibacter palmitatis TaxID=2054628 RepID=A0ABV7ECA6_9SPHN
MKGRLIATVVRALCLTGIGFGAGAGVVAAQDRAAPAPVSAAALPRTGEQIFAAKCVFCHDATGWGTRSLARRTPPGQSELLNRQVLPPALVIHAVRRGIGSMPQFTPTEISDEELAILAAWLDARGRPAASAP